LDGSLSTSLLCGILSFDSLDKIADMERQSLLKIRVTARKPPEGQIWAVHFEAWSSMSSVYASFIASEKGGKESIRTILAE
jgi:hypothetical protein